MPEVDFAVCDHAEKDAARSTSAAAGLILIVVRRQASPLAELQHLSYDSNCYRETQELVAPLLLPSPLEAGYQATAVSLLQRSAA